MILCLSLYSCENRTFNSKVNKSEVILNTPTFNVDELSQHLRTKFDSNATAYLVVDEDTIGQKAMWQKAYQLNDFNPFWMKEEGITKNVTDYIDVLKDIRYDGMNPEHYFLNKIESSLSSLKENEVGISAFEDFEMLLTKSFFKLSNDLLLGSDTNAIHPKDWKNKNDSLFDVSFILVKTIENNNMAEAIHLMRPKHPYYTAFRKEFRRLDSINKLFNLDELRFQKDTMFVGEQDPMIIKLRKRLCLEVALPVDTLSDIWSEDLVQGIKKYQYINHIKSSGKLDSNTINRLNTHFDSKMKSLALNMERLRWLKHDFPQPYIWVDVPKMELNYVEKDSTMFNMRVVVGRPTRPTTLLDAKLENIVFSPPWTVPPTIMKEEVVPGIARRGGSYLARRGLKAYDRRGRIVNASAINASNYKRFTIGQAPGYRSSLGEVKFNLPNPWSIYLHDTPHREDFVKSYRAYSSGCIRVHHPKEFAAFLLQDSLEYSFQKIDSICKERKTIFVPMKRNIMVHIVYLTNALDSAGNVMYLKDIYKWDKI